LPRELAFSNLFPNYR